MNRLLIGIGLIIICFSDIYSQKVYDIELYGTPLYSYRIYKSKNYLDPNLISLYKKGKDYFNDVFKDEVDNLEKPKYGYLFGLRATLNVSKKLFLQTGIEYSSIGEKQDFGLKPLYKYIEWDGHQILMPSDEYYHLLMTYSYNYMSFPVSIKYKLYTFNKIEIIPAIGLSFDFLLYKQVYNTSDNNEISIASKFESSTHEFRKICSAILFGLEFNYCISNRFHLYIAPNLKQYYLPNEIITPKLYIGGESYIFDKINKYNYTFGLNIGMRLVNILNK
jgi:hypothetical protein